MLSRLSVYRARRRRGYGRRAAWATAGLVVHQRRVRLVLYAQPWRPGGSIRLNLDDEGT